MKKFFKGFFLVLLVFMIFLYFVGSCTERPEYKPSSDTGTDTPAYTEVKPDEYEDIMNRAINSSSSFFLTAHASDDSSLLDKIDKLNEFTDLTNYYNFRDGIKDYLDYLRDPDDGYFYDHSNYPPVDSSSFEKPVTSVNIPKQYDICAKNRINYANNVYEIVDIQVSFTNPTTSDEVKNGHILFVRRNSLGYSTSFGFDIYANRMLSSWGSSYGFGIEFMALKSGMTGFDMPGDESFFTSSKGLYFKSESTNSIATASVNSSGIFSKSSLCNNSSKPQISSYGINVYTLCQAVSNDYSFITSLNSYQGSNYSKSVNYYYNNNAGDTVTTNNYTKYSDYGYTYNSVTNSLEFDPDVFANWFDADIVPKLQLTYDDIFSKFPDINATFNDYTGELNNLIEIYNQSTETITTSAISNPPATVTGNGNGGCDCDIYVTVTVDVTLPEEFYRKYPTLTTEPAFVAKNPDTDYAFDEPLPLEILKTSGNILTMVSDIITDSGLMPMYIMCIALSLVAFFLL